MTDVYIVGKLFCKGFFPLSEYACEFEEATTAMNVEFRLTPSIALSTRYSIDKQELDEFRQSLKEVFENHQGFQEIVGTSVHDSGQLKKLVNISNI